MSNRAERIFEQRLHSGMYALPYGMLEPPWRTLRPLAFAIRVATISGAFKNVEPFSLSHTAGNRPA